MEPVLASDADRERVANRLRRHAVEGRLTADEFAQRLDEAYAARTLDDRALAQRGLPDDPVRRRSTAADRLRRNAIWAALVSGIAVLIWAATGADSSFWPKWVILVMIIRLALFAGRVHLRPDFDHRRSRDRGRELRR